MKPPPSRTSDNVAPRGRRATYTAGTSFREFWTPDLQLTLHWPDGALGPDEITFDVEPLDPSEVAPLPKGLTASGNAYRLELLPTGGFVRPATVALKVPDTATIVYHSEDGTSWRPLRRVELETGVAAAELRTDGYVLAAFEHHHSSSRWNVRIVAAVATGAVVLFEIRRRRVRAVSRLNAARR